MNSKNVIWIDLAVAVPVYLLALYTGSNFVMSFVAAGMAASAVNLMGAAGLFGRPRS